MNILSPGAGVGGHCIAIDPWFLVELAPELTPLMTQARLVNQKKPHWVVERIKQRANRLKGPRIACLGLAYKPDIDDLRESPSVEIAHELKKIADVDLRVVEPNIEQHPDFDLVPLEKALDGADIVVVLVGHREFSKIPGRLLEEKIVMDVCGALRQAKS